MQAITVCLNYTDYLAIALRHNRKFFKTYSIVTSKDDTETLALCKGFDCTPLILPFESDYVKKTMMSQGLKMLQRPGWIQILDADIVLPEDYSKIVETVEGFNQDTLHGCQRVFCQNKLVWDMFGMTDLSCYEEETNPRAVGIGFFQLFHARAQPLACVQDWYAVANDHKAADMSFRAKFCSIQKLPITAVHLGPASVNWYGRRSPKFV